MKFIQGESILSDIMLGRIYWWLKSQVVCSASVPPPPPHRSSKSKAFFVWVKFGPGGGESVVFFWIFGMLREVHLWLESRFVWLLIPPTPPPSRGNSSALSRWNLGGGVGRLLVGYVIHLYFPYFVPSNHIV